MGASCDCGITKTFQESIANTIVTPAEEHEEQEDLEAPSVARSKIHKKSASGNGSVGINSHDDAHDQWLVQPTQDSAHTLGIHNHVHSSTQHQDQKPATSDSPPNNRSRSCCCKKRRSQNKSPDGTSGQLIGGLEAGCDDTARMAGKPVQLKSELLIATSDHMAEPAKAAVVLHTAPTSQESICLETCDPKVLREPIATEATTSSPKQADELIHEISVACSVCQYELAERLVEQLLRLTQVVNGIDGVRTRLPELDKIPSRVERAKTMLKACAPQTEKGWKQFDLDTCSIWRRWDSQSGAITIILSWVARGSLLQHIAAVWDADVLEPLWNGAVWDMRCEQANGISLNRWLEKDPFTRRKFETIMERTLCDCLDHDRPCWVLLERSPQVDNWESFHGNWETFDIPACPKGYFRGVTGDGGRVIEPVTLDTCRVSMSITLHLPAVVRWALTDGLLCMAINMGSKSTGKSWDNIINKWDLSGFEQRMKDNSSFYGPLQNRIDQHMSKRT